MHFYETLSKRREEEIAFDDESAVFKESTSCK